MFLLPENWQPFIASKKTHLNYTFNSTKTLPLPYLIMLIHIPKLFFKKAYKDGRVFLLSCG